MKGLRIGRRRAHVAQASPLELALRPALVDGRWQVPDKFNFTRDVVEALAGDPRRNAVTILGRDGVIEPRTFIEIAEAAARRAATLTEHGVHPKDRVVVMAQMSMHWLELVLGIWKAGAVAVPLLPSVSADALDALLASTEASLIVAEAGCKPTIMRLSFEPEVLYVEEEPRKRPSSTLKIAPTHDTSSRDLALVFVSPGTSGAPKEIGHTHGSVFATRMQAEHWLDAGRGDVVWCTAEADSPLAAWFTLAGPWSRGAESVIHQGGFDPQERLEHLYRIGPTILCQSAAEYRALAEHEKLERFRPPRLRRLVSTGDVLEPEVVAAFHERWGLAIHDGYGQAETNVFVGDGDDAMWKPGSIGRALPGYDVVIVDDQGAELPNGVEGDLAVRGHPPTLFAGYWDEPEETKRAFRGDLYLTGDVAVADEDGFVRYVARAEDVITSSGRSFGPYEVEHVLRSHAAISAAAVVGVRDLQRGGHFVRAYVVAVRGVAGTEQLEAELRQFLGEVLPEQQVPREIVVVEELPMIRGRLNRALLRERPLAGRPLWEAPPTPEPEVAAVVERPPAPVPEPPLPQVAEAAPVMIPAPVPVEPMAEPVVVEPAAAVEPAPEPVPIEPEPIPVVEPEPVVVQAVPVQPLPEEPVAVPEQFEPVEAVEAGSESVVEPEPVSAEPEPEPDLTVEPVSPVEAEAVAPEHAPLPEPEPVTVTLPEPEPAQPAPEPVGEAAPVPEVEPERKPELRIVPQPHAEEPVEAPVAEPPASEPETATAQTSPEPTPRPEAEPLPEYVVPPAASDERAVAPPPPPPEPEPEPDLGPLPDYVVDPDRPPHVRIEPPARQAAHAPPLTGRDTGSGEQVSGAAAAGLYFPPVTSFPPPREEREPGDGEAPRAEPRRTPRRRPTAESATSKSRPSQEEPGDETAEAGWMAGLSNRLSAYSLAEEADQDAAGPSGEDTSAEDEHSSEQAS